MRIIFSFIVMFVLSSSVFADFKKGTFLQDDEIEIVLKRFCQHLFDAAKMNAKPQIYVIVDSDINAAATLNNTFVFNTGFITSCRNVNEFVSVLAHETAHIKGAHPLLQFTFSKKSMVPGAFVMALGALGALLSGHSEILLAGINGGLDVMERGFFKYSRMQEETADAVGIELLEKLQWPIEGFLTFFEQIQTKYNMSLADRYLSTHPFPDQRIEKIKAYLKSHPQKNNRVPQELEEQFERIKAKIRGLVMDKKKIKTISVSNDSITDSYTRAMVYFRMKDDQNFFSVMDALLAKKPQDSYFLELKGQYLLEKGRIEESIQFLKKAKEYRDYAYGLDLLLAHAFTQSNNQVQQAIPLLTTYLHRYPESYLGWHFLGVAYGKTNKIPEASLCLAEKAYQEGDHKRAEKHLEKAFASKDAFILEKAKLLKEQLL